MQIKAQARSCQTNCAGCHNSPNKVPGFDYILETDRVEEPGPARSGESRGLARLHRIADDGNAAAGQSQRPSNSDTTVLYQWIKVCSTNAPPADADAGVDPGDEAARRGSRRPCDDHHGNASGEPPAWEERRARRPRRPAPVARGPPPRPFPVLHRQRDGHPLDLGGREHRSELADQPFQRYFSLAHLEERGRDRAGRWICTATRWAKR